MTHAGALSANSEAVFVLLFVVATAVAIAVRRLPIPYTVALVIAGLVLGVAHAFQAPSLSKDLLFSVFLPGLVFEAAFHIEFKEFWRNRLAIVRVLLAEKDEIIRAFQQGILNHETYNQLLADLDARLLRVESGEIPEIIPQKDGDTQTPSPGSSKETK